MAILVMCSNPNCGDMFDAPDNSAGQKVRCPSCGRVQASDGEASKATPPVNQLQEPPAEPVSKAPAQKPAIKNPAEPAKLAAPQKPEELIQSPPKITAPEPVKIDLAPDFDTPAEKKLKPSQKLNSEMKTLADNEAGLSEVFDELYFPSKTAGLTHDRVEAAAPETDIEALGSKSVAATVLILGVLGMAAGVFGGIKLTEPLQIVAIFVGAGVGWIAGFSMGILLVFVIDKGGSDQVRCTICGEVIAAAANVCKWCGSPAPTMDVNPMTGYGLAAGTYARGNITCLIGMGALAMLVYVLGSLAFELPRLFPDQLGQTRPYLIGVAALVGLFVFGFWMRYLRSVVTQTMKGKNKIPEDPATNLIGDFTAGIHGLAVLVFYVGALFPLPLLPLGLLSMSMPNRRSLLGLPWAVRTVGQFVGNYVILWLLILLWLAGMALGVVLVEALFSLKKMLPDFTNPDTQLIVYYMLNAIKVLFTGAVVGAFLVAVFRCIGMFGRINADTFQPVSPDDLPKQN